MKKTLGCETIHVAAPQVVRSEKKKQRCGDCVTSKVGPLDRRRRCCGKMHDTRSIPKNTAPLLGPIHCARAHTE